jgi:hypothetical protein
LSQIFSLKELYILKDSHIILTSYSGAKDCLRNLLGLHCSSNISPEFFYQLSQICHNISLNILMFKKVTSNGLTLFKKNLKYLDITQIYDCKISHI